jgi:hypothetical protein
MSDKNGNSNPNPENIIEENSKEKENKEKNPLTINNDLDGLKYTILKEDFPVYDLSFKIIIIGDSGKY